MLVELLELFVSGSLIHFYNKQTDTGDVRVTKPIINQYIPLSPTVLFPSMDLPPHEGNLVYWPITASCSDNDICDEGISWTINILII
jgi:hypothetical protein